MLALVEQLLSTVATLAVGMLIPAYKSFKVLKANGDAKPLLAYWVCFAVWTQVTYVFEALYLHQLIPLYYLFKVGGLCYLVAPHTNAATKLYEKLLEPFLVQHEAKIDEFTSAGIEMASSKISALKAQVSTAGPAAPASAEPKTAEKPDTPTSPDKTKAKKATHAD